MNDTVKCEVIDNVPDVHTDDDKIDVVNVSTDTTLKEKLLGDEADEQG